MSRRRNLVIYFDDASAEQIHDFLFIVPHSDRDRVVNMVLKERGSRRVYLFLESTCVDINCRNIAMLKSQGVRILYDYMDEFDEEMSSSAVYFLRQRHIWLLENRIPDLVIVSSRKLYKEVQEKFPECRILPVENGVDYHHFRVKRDVRKVSDRMKQIISENKPIIGYFGVIAPWIDVDLIHFAARKRPDWNFVIIGPYYDPLKTPSLQNLPNLHHLGPIHYRELPHYAVWFDVAIIPFREGNLAGATSPVKLYEYMALNKPVVYTRSMEECKRYRSPLMAEDREDFIRKIEVALQLGKDPGYIAQVDQEARQNTWEVRVNRILQALRHLEIRRMPSLSGSGSQEKI